MERDGMFRLVAGCSNRAFGMGCRTEVSDARPRRPRVFISLLAIALLACALAPRTVEADEPPVLRVAGETGETLKWTVSGTRNTYRLSTKGPGIQFSIIVVGRTYTPPAVPGATITYRVKAAYNESVWSNAVSIEYPSSEEPPEEGEPPSEEEPPEEPTGAGVGRPKYRLDAATYFDPFGIPLYVPWLENHVSGVLAYPSFGDRYVKVRPTVSYHDPSTEGFSPLNAANIERYILKVKRDAGVGYAGPFVDDVNWSVGYRDGGQSRTLEPEKHELATLLAAIRAAEPNAEIEINSQYHDIWPLMKAHDPDVERALRLVDVVTKEFGVGPSAGISTAQDYLEFTHYVDALHAKGIQTVLTGDYHNNNVPTMEYNLATYFLINNGDDFVSGVNQTPLNWWSGFNVNLGEALGPRERSASGVWTRRFSRGVVYTVEPGASTQTIALGRRLHSAEWGSVESITLAPRQGAVLVE